MAKQTKPILDTSTGKEYPSMYAAGKDLAGLVNGDPTNRLVWFSIARAFPTRFHTKNVNGAWVALDDPSVPKITRIRRTETVEQKRARLLAELGELELVEKALAKQGASAGKVSPAVRMKTEPRAAVVGTIETSEIAEEEVEEEAANPKPPKLAAAMKQ